MKKQELTFTLHRCVMSALWFAGVSIATTQQYSRQTGNCCLQNLVSGSSLSSVLLYI